MKLYRVKDTLAVVSFVRRLNDIFYKGGVQPIF